MLTRSIHLLAIITHVVISLTSQELWFKPVVASKQVCAPTTFIILLQTILIGRVKPMNKTLDFCNLGMIL